MAPAEKEEQTTECTESSPELVKLQYERAAQNLRHYQNLVWQMVSVIAGINAGIILVTFRYVSDIIAQLALILIGIALTLILFVATAKHRFFATTSADTLRAIESEFAQKHVQIATNPIKMDSNYWSITTPQGVQSFSAAKTLMRGIMLILFVMIVLFIYVLFFYHQPSG